MASGSGFAFTYLQHAHAIGVAQNLLCICVVAVADVCGGYKQGEWVLFLCIQQASLHHLLDLASPLFPVTVT